ncbi:hypothetical protein H1C71_011822, partial [Ictidomys tridecemlineatus]
HTDNCAQKVCRVGTAYTAPKASPLLRNPSQRMVLPHLWPRSAVGGPQAPHLRHKLLVLPLPFQPSCPPPPTSLSTSTLPLTTLQESLEPPPSLWVALQLLGHHLSIHPAHGEVCMDTRHQGSSDPSCKSHTKPQY